MWYSKAWSTIIMMEEVMLCCRIMQAAMQCRQCKYREIPFILVFLDATTAHFNASFYVHVAMSYCEPDLRHWPLQSFKIATLISTESNSTALGRQVLDEGRIIRTKRAHSKARATASTNTAAEMTFITVSRTLLVSMNFFA